jgi:adenylate kinase
MLMILKLLTLMLSLLLPLCWATDLPKSPTYIILVGPPGSGKGTLSEKIATKSQLPVITTSQVLKRQLDANTAQAKQIKQKMAAGELISDDTILAVMKDEIAKSQYTNGAIFDGFPRTASQTQFFEDNDLTVQMVVVLNISDDEIVRRMQGRRVHGPSGRVYHVDNRPPITPGIDDVTGEPLEQRADDQPDIVRSRLTQYHSMTKPVISWANGETMSVNGIVQQVIELNADQNLEQIWTSLCKQAPSQDAESIGCHTPAEVS